MQLLSIDKGKESSIRPIKKRGSAFAVGGFCPAPKPKSYDRVAKESVEKRERKGLEGQIKLFPYQQETVERIIRFRGRALLAHEMGLGKTICVLAFLRKSEMRPLPALVICPASVKHNWEYEARRLGFSTQVINGRKTYEIGGIKEAELVVINYDLLKNWHKCLRDRHFRTVILDECHYLQNPRTIRYRATREIVKNVPYILALSGTPLTNRPRELYTTLHLLRPDEFNSFFQFAHRYCAPRLTPWGWDYSGASHIDELHRRLERSCMIRYLKSDVMHQLPKKMREVVPIEIDDMDEYRTAERDFVQWLAKNKPERMSSALNAVQLVRVGELLRLAARLKLKRTVDWINRFLLNTNEKIVLFAYHKKCIEVLKNRLLSNKVVVIDGGTPPVKRRDAVYQFQHDPRTRVFIGNIHAAGVGITLTAARTVGFVELYWRPGDHSQAEDRVHRIGQDETVWVYYFVATDTIEERLCRLIQRKQEIISKTLDGKKRNDALDVYNQLLESYTREGGIRDV